MDNGQLNSEFEVRNAKFVEQPAAGGGSREYAKGRNKETFDGEA